MFQPERLATIGFAARRRPNGLVASVMWLAGMIAAVAGHCGPARARPVTASSRSSSRNRALNDSMKPFSHGLPGSM